MERNWCWNGKKAMMDVTPFLLFESTGDSEEVKAVADHEEAAAMDESEGVLFHFDDGDDDAQSSSYDQSSYINSHHDQTQGLIHDHDFDGDDDDDDDDDDWGESSMMDESLHQKGSRKFCVDSSNQNQREIDRNFWETCLAT